MCLNITASGVIDGCGADASWQSGTPAGNGHAGAAGQSWGLDSSMAEAWNTGHKQMMRQTTAALQVARRR